MTVHGRMLLAVMVNMYLYLNPVRPVCKARAHIKRAPTVAYAMRVL